MWLGKVHISDKDYPIILTLKLEKGKIIEGLYENPDYNTTMILDNISVDKDGITLKGENSNSKLSLRLKEETNGILKGFYQVETRSTDVSYEVTFTPQNNQRNISISALKSSTESTHSQTDILYLA